MAIAEAVSTPLREIRRSCDGRHRPLFVVLEDPTRNYRKR